MKFDFSQPLIRVALVNASLTIQDNVFIRGTFFFEKGGSFNATLDNNTRKEVRSITFGALNATMFFGNNGPYRTDTNGDGIITIADEANADRGDQQCGQRHPH